MNRLAESLSPYLLQHKDNPVDWYPWGEEAFEKARSTDRPIFLSVGYAACHWCHVMEHESFEDETVARYLNDNFVSIKVDREERPDIDQIYMNAVQVMHGHGGWPMSVFLNHQLQPFYAGTYWPPRQRFGMPGFSQVLSALVDAWQNRRTELEQHAGEVTTALQQLAIGVSETGNEIPSVSHVTEATSRLLDVLDRTHGGFGGAPKFPHATDLDLLLRQGVARQQGELIEAACFTLDKMAAGGIYDHLGGGFARYSVDAQWLVPHFEKMLYDNALLGEVYVRAFQVTGDAKHANVARGVFDYLLRDMVDDAGGFHSSEDADSEGVEGKYYVWTPAEVCEVLGTERGQRFCAIYDITEQGNFEGKSIPRLQRDFDAWADELGIARGTLVEQLAGDREQLRKHREGRVRPGRDDKVLTNWNALAIKALAVGGSVLDCPRYLEAAHRAAMFLRETMMPSEGKLLHAFRRGKAHLDAYADDYAYTIEAFIALFEATGQAEWIEHAVALADQMLASFEDAEGGFFFTASDAESLLTRNKEWHDGSLVSSNASAVSGLLHLAALTGRDAYRQAAERTLQAATQIVQKQSAACAALLSALDRYWNADEQVVIAVPDEQTFEQLRPKVYGSLQPHVTHSWVIGAAEDAPAIALNQHRGPVDGKVAVYRCKHFTCDQPLVGEEAEQRW